jgi:hypothetical protein
MTEVILSFDEGSGFSSGAIEYFGAGGWSHVDNVTPRGLLGARSDRIGGQPSGVWPRPSGYQKGLRRQVRMSLACTAAQYQTWLNFLYLQTGKPYDRLAILGFIIARDWRDESAWFCSELAARALEVAGVLPPLSLTPNKITPGALALAVSAAGGRVVS